MVRPRGPRGREFISYAQQSRKHVANVVELANRLVENGFDVLLDQFVKFPEVGWAAWAERGIQRSDYVVVVASSSYLRRYNGQERMTQGRGATWEAAIVRQALYESGGRNTHFVPVLFGRERRSNVPPLLRQYQVYRLWKEWPALLAHLAGDAQERSRTPALSKPTLGGRAWKEKPRSIPSSPGKPSTWTDPVRGRMFLENGLAAFVEKWHDVPLSIAILDIDGLTQINKHYGEGVGNAVLQKVEQLLLDSVGEGNAARCGDDTFFAIMIQHDLTSAIKFAGKLCARIRSIKWRHVAPNMRVTCSVGVAEQTEDERAVKWALRAAVGMKAAKTRGGNVVEQGPLFLGPDEAEMDVSTDLVKGSGQEAPRYWYEAPSPKVRWPFS